MNTYELTVILRTKDLESLQGKLKEILQKHDVTITKEDDWGNKKLAYQVEGEGEGYYSFMHIETSPEAIKNVISDFRLTSGILRYLFVKTKQKKSA